MREVDRPGCAACPVAAHEWEPLPGSSTLGPWPWVAACGTRSRSRIRNVCGRWLVEGAGNGRPGAAGGWSVLIWGSRRGTRCGCWRRAGRRCARRRACRRWSRCWRWSAPRWPGAPEGTRLAVVFEPTGPAWMPIAVFFARRGHAVFRVSSAKAADLRKFFRRHAKSNGIDAETLARMPLADPRGCSDLELPGPDAAALDRRVRACERLTEAASQHKVRIKDLVRQLMPMTPLTGDLGKADLAVLERYADPRALLAAGQAELTALITTASRDQQGPARARQWIAAAQAAIELYGRSPGGAVRGAGRRGRHRDPAAARHPGRAGDPRRGPENAYRQVDPGQLARSLPGLRRDQRPGPGRHHGQARPVPRRDPVQVLSRPRPAGQRDRRDRPQGPADEQGRAVPAAGHLGPRRRHRPPPGPPARPDLLPADDRARRHPPQGLLRRRRPPRRTAGPRCTAAPRT